jgi:two-component system, LytTR family, sensor kinase
VRFTAAQKIRGHEKLGLSRTLKRSALFVEVSSAFFAMDYILDDVCVLVTTAFALTFLPGFRKPQRSLLSIRDQGTALLVFLVLGLVEEIAASEAVWLNERIVAACTAGLVAGPWVGLLIGVFVTWLAVAHHGLPLGSIAISMLSGGLVGGWLHRWRPKLAQHPLTGFSLTFGVSLMRNVLLFLSHQSPVAQRGIEQMVVVPALQGFGTALILAIVQQVRDRDEQIRALASAEVRAMQARMNPHFLFNALNALAGLAKVAPREVPRATGWLRKFLRASFDQPERPLVPLDEELAVLRAYLKIESLRFGDRLKVEESIDPDLLKVLIPPFSFQPLVENAIQHGLGSSPSAGRLRIVIRAIGTWLEMSVCDDGQGVPSAEIERIFFAERPGIHALVLLRRRLEGLFGRSFQLEVHSEVGDGTTATVRIPLKRPSGVGGEWPGSLVLSTAGDFSAKTSE